MLSSDVSVDLVLLQRIVARDERAVAELYDRHGRLVFSVIRRILHNASDAEDVLQETFVRVWSRADSYDAALGSPATWLTRIARNRAVDRLRAQRTRADVDGPVPDTLDSGEIRMTVADVSDRPDVRAEDISVASALRGAVARLPEAQRVLIEAAYFEGYTHQELAVAVRSAARYGQDAHPYRSDGPARTPGAGRMIPEHIEALALADAIGALDADEQQELHDARGGTVARGARRSGASLRFRPRPRSKRASRPTRHPVFAIVCSPRWPRLAVTPCGRSRVNGSSLACPVSVFDPVR